MGTGAEFELRRAVAADAAAVTRLVRDAYQGYEVRIGRTPIPMLTDQAVAIREHEVWVLAGPADAEGAEPGSLAGVLELVPLGDHLLVESVAVAPQHQGRGFGSRLLGLIEQRADELGVPEIRLYTNERFVENLAMYAGRGYRETHRTPLGRTSLVHLTKQARWRGPRGR
jgi:GNAT superfamily N-acetyltransferase